MAPKPKEVSLAEVKTNKAELIKAQAKSINELEELKKQIPVDKKGAYKSITTEIEYAAADRRRSAAKGIINFTKKLLDPGIKKIREGLNDLLETRKVVTVGGDEVVEIETGRMLEYKNAERKKIAEATEEANKEKERLQAIADAQLARANMLKSATARDKALDKAAEAQVKAETVSVKVSAIEADNSTTRTYKKCKLVNKVALIEYIVKMLDKDERHPQTDLTSLLDVNIPELNAYFKLEDPAIGDWIPGVIVEESLNLFSKKQA